MTQLARARRFQHAFGLLTLLGSTALGAGCASDVEESEQLAEPDSSVVKLPLGVGGFCGGERCDSVARGMVGFFSRKLHGLNGNGRACADCHMPTDSFQLSPANVEARYQALQARRRVNPNADDPLFRPVDADDFRVNGEQASDYANLRQNGLVRVTFNLPPNVKLIDPATNQPSSETFVDVWRAVPSVLDVALSGPDNGVAWPRGPNQRGGYQLDARFGTLQEQAEGALFAHAEITNAPSQRLLDDLSAFQRVLFSSSGTADLAEALRTGTSPLPDADPPLNELETQGKTIFARACGQCHGGPTQTTPTVLGRYHDIASACPRPVDPQVPARWQFSQCEPRIARNVRLYEVTLPNGAKVRRPSSDPGRALITGFAFAAPPPLDDWQKLDNPPLRNLRNTAPYFHNNSAATLDAVLDHYEQMFKFAAATAPPGIVPGILTTNGTTIDRPFTAAERPALLAYLKKI